MRFNDDPVTVHLRALRRRDIRRVVGTLMFSFLSAPLVGIAQIELEQWLAAEPPIGQSHGPTVEWVRQAGPVGRGAHRVPLHRMTFSTCGCVSAWQGEAQVTSKGDIMTQNTKSPVGHHASRPLRRYPAEAISHD